MVVNDLTTNFRFTGSTAPLSDFAGTLSESIGLIFGFDKGLVGLAQSAASFVTDIVGSIDPLVQLSRETGVAVGKMQELGYVASQNGGSVDDVTASIAGLSEKIADASISGSEDFAKLGLSIYDSAGGLKSADKMLEDLRQRFKGLNFTMQQQKGLASSLGISDGLIQTLNLTDEAMERLTGRANDLGLISQEEADSVADLNNSMEAFSFMVDSVKRSLNISFLPILKSVISSVNDFVAENRGLVVGVLKVVIPAITAFVAMLSLVAVKGLFLTGVMTALTAVSTAFGAVMAVLTSPITLVVGMVVSLILILDDLYEMFTGGESVIGKWVDKFMELEVVKEFLESISSLWSSIGDKFSSIGDFFGMGDAKVEMNSGNNLPATQNSSSNVNQDVVININAKNADDARRGVEQALDYKAQLQSASFQADRG